ncbi:hypothetical protein [Thiocapsa imhoffii]|nr:hypothetical protein [Thiocapsa imhoffii]
MSTATGIRCWVVAMAQAMPPSIAECAALTIGIEFVLEDFL